MLVRNIMMQKIDKFIKLKDGKYKLTGDKTLVLTSETILKYNLLVNKSFADKELNDILEYDKSIEAYNKIIKLLNRKFLTEKEIIKKLKDDNIKKEYIDKIINKLKDNNFINDKVYLQAYIDDEINLKMTGPRKIETDLLKLGFNDQDIKLILNDIEENVWLDKINKMIQKKLKCNHTKSGLSLKINIASYIVHLGYSKEMVMPIIDKYDYINMDVIKKEYEKQNKLLSKKYSGEELNKMIRYKLINKGYKEEEIDKINE
jgi:regulatory protein